MQASHQKHAILMIRSSTGAHGAQGIIIHLSGHLPHGAHGAQGIIIHACLGGILFHICPSGVPAVNWWKGTLRPRPAVDWYMDKLDASMQVRQLYAAALPGSTRRGWGGMLGK